LREWVERLQFFQDCASGLSDCNPVGIARLTRIVPLAMSDIDTRGQTPKYFAMRNDGILKHLALALVIALVFYVAGFTWLEHRRAAKGPWEVTFRTDAAGTPSLWIAQTNLGIGQAISFPARKAQPPNLSRAVRFAPGTTDLPFGEMLYQDPTFLPGTVTMRVFDHQIELLPRILTIDKKEYPWNGGGSLELP
jgi:hypothetical protein